MLKTCPICAKPSKFVYNPEMPNEYQDPSVGVVCTNSQCRLSTINYSDPKFWYEHEGLAAKAWNTRSELVSDGYHTFRELYMHRTALLAALANSHPDKAIKSQKHSDGSMYEDMFIVMMDLEGSQISYHCESGYWDWFDIKEVETAPEWDGHSPEDVVERLVDYKW